MKTKSWEERFDEMMKWKADWIEEYTQENHSEIKSFILSLLSDTALIQGERRRIIAQLREEVKQEEREYVEGAINKVVETRQVWQIKEMLKRAGYFNDSLREQGKQ